MPVFIKKFNNGESLLVETRPLDIDADSPPQTLVKLTFLDKLNRQKSRANEGENRDAIENFVNDLFSECKNIPTHPALKAAPKNEKWDHFVLEPKIQSENKEILAKRIAGVLNEHGFEESKFTSMLVARDRKLQPIEAALQEATAGGKVITADDVPGIIQQIAEKLAQQRSGRPKS